MTPDAKFEGMALAKLDALEARVEDVLAALRVIEGRCMSEHVETARLAAEVGALREKTDFNSKVIWGAVVWVVMSAGGFLLTLLGGRK